MATIHPDEIQLYEILDFDGAAQSHDPDYNYPELQRAIRSLLHDHPARDRIRFFMPSRHYDTVTLCYAVDSIIYLPVYVAEAAHMFEQNLVRVTHFPAPGGDVGAIQEVVSGRADFALCDPQAALDFLTGYYRVDRLSPSQPSASDPVLVAVLINRLALWTVARARPPLSALGTLASRSSVVTYLEGSTASSFARWFLRHAKGASALPREVPPGDEFRVFLLEGNGTPYVDGTLLTADILGSTWVSQNYSHEALDKRPLAETDVGTRFLFTGLLVRRDMLDDHPRAVEGLVSALLEAARVFQDDDPAIMPQARQQIRDSLERLVRSKQPWYLQHVPERAGGTTLPAALDASMIELRRLRLYSSDGRLRWRDLFHALVVRGAGGRRRPSAGALRRWIGHRAGGWMFRLLVFLFAKPLLSVSTSPAWWHAAAFLVLGGITAAAIWVGSASGASHLWATIPAISGSLAATSLLTFFVTLVVARRARRWLGGY